jgi:hypothetical protein
MERGCADLKIWCPSDLGAKDATPTFKMIFKWMHKINGIKNEGEIPEFFKWMSKIVRIINRVSGWIPERTGAF